jgi:branched-chain amino acid transport system ATP-binding protein/branched-chain amino acid transport system permease protein
MSTRDLVATVPRRLAILVGAMVLIGVLGQFNAAIGLAPYNIVVLYTVLFWISQATSWNLLSGYAGYFSFGQGAYLGIGAYTMAVMTGRHNVDYLISIPVGGLLAGVLALLVGAVAFRLRSLRGEIFALLTLAVPFILAAIARINSEIDGGQGTTLRTPPSPDWIGDFQHLMFLLNLVVATLAVGVALAVHGSRFGRGLAAVHDAEDAAEVLGVPTFRYKMIAIVLGAMLGGISGALLAMSSGYVVVESVFTLSIPLFVILICVLGGRRHWLGPVIGAAFLVVLQDRLVVGGLGSWRDIILGALLAGLVVLAPEGLYGRLRAQPWLALASFLVVCVGLLLSGYYAELDAVLYGMLVGAMVAIAGDWWRRRRARFRVASSTSDEPGPAEPVPAEVAPAKLVPAQAVRAPAVTAPAVLVGTAETAAEAIAAPTVGDRVLVSVRGVTRDFGGVRALDGVSVEVRQGELVGLVGPNGSGKTTLVNLLSGAMQPTSGEIAIAGRVIRRLAPHRVAHTGVARTYQIPKPFPSMTVRDNVAMAVMFGRTGASLASARQQAEPHLATVRLGHLADALPDSLNLHQRQLLEMARAIAAEPTVLLLDEALAGLNPAEIDDAVAVIKRIHTNGISVIIVEHLLRVLQQLATRIVVLNRGVVIADGTPSTVLNDPAVVHAYLGRQRA